MFLGDLFPDMRLRRHDFLKALGIRLSHLHTEMSCEGWPEARECDAVAVGNVKYFVARGSGLGGPFKAAGNEASIDRLRHVTPTAGMA